MDLTNIKTIKKLCQEYGIRPSRKLGQNFLVNQEILEKVVEAGELEKDDVVLEIGPGFGVLTQELIKRASKLAAVEKDKRLVEYLSQKTQKHKNIKTQLEIINGDVLNKELFDCSIAQLLGDRYKVISNLPYQITSPVLWKFLNSLPTSPFVRGRGIKPEMMVLMVQKEVAERITAKPGKMSLLSVLCRFYAACEIVSVVKKGSFWPAPQVDSAIIKLKIKDKKLKIKEVLFFKIVKAGFANKRKMLKNNLVKGLGLTDKIVLDGFEYVGLSEKVRAQELSVDEWVRLSRVLKLGLTVFT